MDIIVASEFSNRLLARLPANEEIIYPQPGQTDSNQMPKAFNAQSAIRRLFHFIAEEKPFFVNEIKPEDLKKILCVKSKKTNNRISSQSGAFLLFGDNAILDEGGNGIYRLKRFSIGNKKKILSELDAMNINSSTVFPNIENSARYIADKYSFKEGVAN